MQPTDYNIEYGNEITHPDYGEATVVSAESWPVLVETPDGDERELFEFQAEQVIDTSE